MNPQPTNVRAGSTYVEGPPVAHYICCRDCGPLVGVSCTVSQQCECSQPDWHDPDLCGCPCHPHVRRDYRTPCRYCTIRPEGIILGFPLGTQDEAEAWCTAHNQRTGHTADHYDEHHMTVISGRAAVPFSTQPASPGQEPAP